MFSSRRCLRQLWSKIVRPNTRTGITCSALTIYKKFNNPSSYCLPTTIGFTLFTWLGFEKKQSPEDELILTIKHSVLLIQRNQYEKAEQLLHIALRQAQQMSNQLGITYVYDVLANLALERQQLEKAKKLFISVSQRLMSDGVLEDDMRIIHISLKLARISHLKKEYNTAQLGFDWCLKKLNDENKRNPTEDGTTLIALGEDWYGRLFLDCEQPETAVKFMISSLNRILQLPEVQDEEIIIQLNDIATICSQLDRYDESEKYLKQAIERGKSLENVPDMGAMYVNLGRIYIKKNMLEEARKSCGYGWRLGHDWKNEDVKAEADLCIKEINKLT